MRYAFAALLPTLALAASPQVEIRYSEVWLIRDGQETQLTRDGKPKLGAALSPSWDRVAYSEKCPESEQCRPSIVLLDLTGRRLSTFQPKAEGGQPCGSVLSLAWTGAGAIAAVCHINPGLGEYIETDLASGAVRRDLLGYWFTPSPDGKRVAHVGWIPHEAPPFAQSNYLQVDETTLYPLPKGSGPVTQKPGESSPAVVENQGNVFTGIHEFKGGFAWAADSDRVALVDCTFDWLAVEGRSQLAAAGREANRRCALVVVSMKGEAKQIPLDQMVQDQLDQPNLVWTGTNQVLLEAGDIVRTLRVP